MKILIITQVMDKNDTVLGFFHRWTSEFSKKFDQVSVICLKEGAHTLPSNVKVYSLGKEKKESRIQYVSNFYKHIFALKDEYDAVFVHMNQEYVLLGGIFWKIWGKKVFMWRNHHSGGNLTDVAAAFCDRVFCTSRFSYTAQYEKTLLMPVGIDTEFFKKDASVVRNVDSILFLARIAPVKKPHILIEALNMIHKQGKDFRASFYGDPLPKDRGYLEDLKKKVVQYGLSDKISFCGGVPNDATPAVYSAHQIFVNLSSSGMYDKTIFESAACESLVLASNENLRGLFDDVYILKQDDTLELVQKLTKLLDLSQRDKESLGKNFRKHAESQSLEKLVSSLIVSMQ